MIESGTVITPELRENWLAERSQGIGASEVAAIVGASPWMSPIEIWQQKTGRTEPVTENESMRWGSLLEPVVIGEYERRNGVVVTGRQRFVRHPLMPFFAATLDGVAGDKLIEIKTTSAFSKDFGDEESDEIPDQYRVQIHAQMAVTGLERAELVVLIGGQRLKVYPVERHVPLVNLIEDRVGEFWRFVQDDTPPTWGKLTPAALAWINPDCEGVADWTAADVDRVECAVADMERNKEVIANLETENEALKVRVLEALGSAKTGFLSDGRKVNRYLEHVPARTVNYEAKAYTKHYIRVLKGRA